MYTRVLYFSVYIGVNSIPFLMERSVSVSHSLNYIYFTSRPSDLVSLCCLPTAIVYVLCRVTLRNDLEHVKHVCDVLVSARGLFVLGSVPK